MRAALTICAKDLRERVRDRSAIIYGLIAPLGLALVFAALFSDATVTSLDLRFGVHNADRGPLGGVLVDDVLGSLDAEGVATVEAFASRDLAAEAVESGELTAAYIVPADFSESFVQTRPATVEVLGSVDAPIGTQVAEAIATAFGEELTGVQLAVSSAVASGATVSEPTGVGAELSAMNVPLVLGVVAGVTRELDVVTYLSAGMAVFFLFFTVQFGVTSLLEERRLGTLPRLFAAPIPRGSVYLAKALTSLALGLVAMTVLVIATDLLVGAEWGAPVGVALLVIGGVLAATGVMSVLATFAKDAEQANIWQSVTAVILGAFGGSFFPVAPSGALATVSLLTPHRWFLRGLGGLANGGPVAAVYPAFAALLAFALLGGLVTVARLRTAEELR